MKVWLTKYALTQGITIAEVELNAATPGIAARDLGHYRVYLYPSEWHRTIQAAQVTAEALRQRKIVSLEKQLAHVRALRFDEEPATAEEQA